MVDNLDPAYSPDQKKANLSRAAKKGSFQFEERDLRQGVEDLLPADRIIHLAACHGEPSGSDQAFHFHDVNVNASLSLFETARKTGTPRILMGSSSEVYGNHPTNPFPDDAGLLTPVSFHGATKLAAENYLRVYSELHGLEGTILRFFSPYGPGGGRIDAWVRQIESEEEIELPGEGHHQREYTFVDDVLSGMEASLDHAEPFSFYNLGSGSVISDKTLVSLMEKATGKKSNIRFRAPYSHEVEFVSGAIGKVQTNLGYEPRVSLEEGIRQVISGRGSE